MKNIFDEINEEGEAMELSKPVPTITETITAYQLFKVKISTGTGRKVRDLHRTIYTNGRVEVAKRDAINLAKMVGNCDVVECVERIVYTEL